MKYFFALILVFVLLFSFLGSVVAQESPNDFLTLKVDHVAGRFEKLGEKLSLLFKFGHKSKADYYQDLSEKRLAEIDYVVEAKKFDDVESTASRYSTYLGVLSDYVEKNKVTEKKDDLLSMFDRHEKALSLVQSQFEYNSGWWLVLEHDINTIKIFREKITSL